MINHVKMINWRAYDRYEVEFSPGITFIMGANGIGKTSILEAIIYALTGEPSTVRDRGKLLRDPDKPATISLSFTVNGETYLVERSQSRERAEDASLIRVGERKPLASSHKRVTEQIERLMGVSSDFLQRIVYMAEGDVFRFLDRPPGQALDMQIRRVLGLTQLDQFIQALEKADKELKDRIRSLQNLLGELERLGVRKNTDFERRMQDIDDRQERLVADLQAVQSEIARHDRESEDVTRLAQMIDRALPVLQRDPETWQAAQQKSIPALLAELDSQAAKTQAAMQQYELESARLEGTRVASQGVLDALQPYAGRSETLPCPVCRKPMTSPERESVAQDIKNNIARLNRVMQDLDTRRAQARQALARLQEQAERLREIHDAIVYMRLQNVDANTDIAHLIQFARFQQTGLPDGLQERVSDLEKKLRGIEAERAEYLTARRRLQDLGFASPEEASEALVGLEIRSLSLRAANRAAQDTLTRQRNIDMEAIYAQIARIWSVFSGQEDWRVQLDESGLPMLQNKAGREFDLSQFSGGEKTALLIMLHTIIAHHFSRSDFLLIDEPLEHLDPINRRSLIRFLVDAYRRRSFEQAIIATFEESLIRKYMSEGGVQVVHL